MTPLTPQQAVLQQLRSTYGLFANALGLFGPNQTPANRAMSGVGAAGSASNLSGSFGGPTLPGGFGQAAGLGAAGYGLYNIATNPNLSTGEKIGGSGRVATDTAMSLVPVVGQFYGLARALGLVGQHLEKSGSPQLRGLGRSLDYAAEPAGAKAFWDVAGGKSPAAAFKSAGGGEALMLDTMGPVGLILRGLGVNLPFLHHEPTTGTKFRNELHAVVRKDPTLKHLDTSKYNIDPDVYNSFSVETRNKAQALGKMLASHTVDYAKNPQAYENQAAAALLNQYGDQVLDLAKQMGVT